MTQKTILCYGDSNTWGYVPLRDHAQLKSRYSREQRWTGILQDLLGSEYYIVEEGLNSRTTNLDYAVPPDRNGKTYLPSCLYSHAPIDLVVLGLGGNDMKTYFNRNPLDIKNGLAELVDIIQKSPYGSDMRQAPKILIMTQAIPYPFVEEYTDENGIRFLEGIVAKARELIPLYASLAEEKQCHFIDVSQDVSPSKIDGVHYDLNAHRILAELLNTKIRAIFQAP
jgi:lysophospholipase L1-like esterase